MSVVNWEEGKGSDLGEENSWQDEGHVQRPETEGKNL